MKILTNFIENFKKVLELFTRDLKNNQNFKNILENLKNNLQNVLRNWRIFLENFKIVLEI